MHLFIVVDCKTPGCTAVHILKYLGMEGRVPENTEVNIPVPLSIRCDLCHQTHDYHDTKYHRQLKRSQGTPIGYSNKI